MTIGELKAAIADGNLADETEIYFFSDDRQYCFSIQAEFSLIQRDAQVVGQFES